MDDSEPTVAWRRPLAGEQTVVHQTDRVVEPVQPLNSPVNVNQPGVSPYVSPVIVPSPVRVAVWRAQRVIYYIFGVIEAIILIRFVLRLISANTSNIFTQGVYGVSWVFVFPFNGVVGNANLGGGSVIEFFSLIAILVYALASVALTRLLELLV